MALRVSLIYMSKNSKVLALKYRPQVFEDLIGQNVVAETIYNSIELGKTPNAYLFTGIRGVGKTTIARIVAKALNCKNGLKNLCKQDFCETCDSIMNSNHFNVLMQIMNAHHECYLSMQILSANNEC